MKKRIVISGLVVLLAVAIVGNFTLVMGKKVTQKPKGVKETQAVTKTSQETKGTKTREGEPKKPIIEYKFDEEIVDVIFDEAEITVKEARALGVKGLDQRKPTETVKVQYPKVVVLRDEGIKTRVEVKSIKFLDVKGRIKSEYITDKSRKRRGVAISKNRKYLVVHNIINYETEEAESIMMDDEGKMLWKAKHNLFTVYPSPNGEYIVGVPTVEWGDAPVYVYNEKGLVREIKKDTRPWDLDFSKDGDYFAVTFEKIINEKYTGNLIVLDRKGNELWRRENLSTEGPACSVVISEDDIITVMTGVDEYKIYQFDKKGNLLMTKQGTLEQLRKINRMKEKGIQVKIEEIIK